jgi:ATP phosphoribosyltransferase
MLRVAVPNKGTLFVPAQELLTDAGYTVHKSGKKLTAIDPAAGITWLFLRPTDIARHVGTGVIDVGITGQDLIAEAGTDTATTELVRLGFGGSRFYFAAPKDRFASIGDLHGATVATSFPALVRRAAAEAGVEMSIAELDGAVEVAVELGLADVIADVVETGASLAEAGMVTIGEPIRRSEAVLVRGRGELDADQERSISSLVARLQGVLLARNYVMVDYNCPSDLVDEASKIAPGMEAPTISALAEAGWVAIRVMVPVQDKHQVMDELSVLGARAIFSTPISYCRL